MVVLLMPVVVVGAGAMAAVAVGMIAAIFRQPERVTM